MPNCRDQTMLTLPRCVTAFKIDRLPSKYLCQEYHEPDSAVLSSRMYTVFENMLLDAQRIDNRNLNIYIGIKTEFLDSVCNPIVHSI